MVLIFYLILGINFHIYSLLEENAYLYVGDLKPHFSSIFMQSALKFTKFLTFF